ncbi:MAG TPA: alpha/beta hydrolase [Solirubrobacteraceae bacterium]|nr:alpha/beta hydrolase [Solirubrobacteraceae bacterium]
MASLTVTAPDGRALEVDLNGPEDGDLVVHHTGTPQAGILFSGFVQAGAERGLRHVAYSRPGYASSDRQPGRTVADCTSDVTAIADQLGVERFFVVGTSGGGPHALACAALLGDRVKAAASIAGVAPRDAEDLDWMAGMGAENVEEFGAAEAGEEDLRAWLEDHGAEFAKATGPELHAALGDLLSEVDKSVLTGEFAEYLAQSARRGLEHGVWGWFDDDLAFCREWGFDLASMACPVSIWQGGQDRFVPYAHGEWLASHVAGADAQLHAAHGHLSLAIGAYGDVLDWLLAV